MSDAQEIYVLNKRIRLLQAQDGFRTSLDSVMLAAACPAKAGERFLDMGCGVGSAGLCVLYRVEGALLTGVDIQADAIDLAHKNAQLNSFQDRADFMRSDIQDFQPDEKFDHVICNPPYMEAGTHLISPSPGKAIARGHKDLSLEDWIGTGFHHVKSNGSLTMIHRADQTDAIIKALGKKFGAIEIMPLWPKEGREAKRVIIRAIKDRNTPCKIHPGIILHDSHGDYTKDADDILRNAQALV